MKKILKSTFFLFLIFISISGISQQYLWTSNFNEFFANTETKVITKNEIQNNILNYYQVYDYYYDLSGFTKQEFLKKFENSNSYNFINKIKWTNFTNSIYQSKDPTITCIKYNDGNSPIIMILIYSKEKFDVILFSNKIESGFKSTYHSEDESNKRRFILFYESLIGEIKENIQFLNKSLIEDEKNKIDSLSRETINYLAIEKTSLIDYENKIFTEAQIPAEFPGGKQGWVRYLERTLNSDLPLKNGAPAGIYSVVVSFIVARDGSISDAKVENNPGYGINDEAIRVISQDTVETFSSAINVVTPSTPGSIFSFPNIPIFYLITNNWPESKALITWFDFLNDKDSIAESNRLKRDPPDTIIYLNLPEVAWKAHEKLFREGNPLGQREIQAWIYEVCVLEKGYQIKFKRALDDQTTLYICNKYKE